MNGQLSSFLITLLGVIGLEITAITFTSKNGGKTIVKAQLPAKNPIQFLGPLAFVQTLADVLPPGIFGGDGPAIDLTSTGIRVTYTLGLPPLSIGVFALENISIMTGLDLPYLGRQAGLRVCLRKPEQAVSADRRMPRRRGVRTRRAERRRHPDGGRRARVRWENFRSTWACVGWRSRHGRHLFKLQSTSTTLTGFVDIGGEVSVLGIISISIDLNLSLSYISTAQGSKVQGRATLTISVHVLFFSVSASVSVERSFGSGSGDPRVHQLIGPSDWAAYAAAFA